MRLASKMSVLGEPGLHREASPGEVLDELEPVYEQVALSENPVEQLAQRFVEERPAEPSVNCRYWLFS